MRYDVNILWIDDTPDWQKQQQDLFELNIEQFGLLCYIEYSSDGDSIIDRLSNESTGFKVYDIIFVDYNISSSLLGNRIIDALRNKNIDADILFYSANAQNDIKKVIFEGDGAFEGIYIANRDSFLDKAVSLYKKNIRNLLSLSNIRGFLAEKTSENDYVVNSYILSKFSTLTNEAQERIRVLVQSMADSEIDSQKSKINEYSQIISKHELNIQKLLKLPSSIITLKIKYLIFNQILVERGDHLFDKHSIEEYHDKIVKQRNTVAHKKLEVCKQQRFIKYYDNIMQFERNVCPEDCSEHTDDRKISLKDWLEIVKLTNEYSKLFHILSSELSDIELLPTS